MALAPTPLSQICKGLRAYLDLALNIEDRTKATVVLATPADTAPSADSSDHRLNLFFYRFEPAGLFPDTLPGETGWIRAFCLVTPFAAEEGSISAGENDLRLIGEVIRIFHEKPVFQLEVDGQTYQIQAVFLPLGLDQLNQLWSTQGDTIYRPSVLYEFSLVPVVPAVAAIASPLAGGFSLGVGAGDEAATPREEMPEVVATTPDVSVAAWAPAIAFVHAGTCVSSQSFALGSDELAAFTPNVWVAGRAGESVDLIWETWDAETGWQVVDPATATVITDPTLDPDAVDTATTVALTLPFDDHVGQMRLTAVRTYARASDGVEITVTSNTLLVSVYAG